jgi:hypothetical protein
VPPYCPQEIYSEADTNLIFRKMFTPTYQARVLPLRVLKTAQYICSSATGSITTTLYSCPDSPTRANTAPCSLWSHRARFFVAARTEDPIFPKDGTEETVATVRLAYVDVGAPDRLGTFFEPGAHAFSPTMRAAAYAWLDRWLAPHE